MYSINYMNQGCDFSDTDFRIFRPLRDNQCDLRRSELVFFFKGGLVGYCMMIEITRMALSYYINKLWKDCFLKHHGRTGPESAARGRGAICRIKSVQLIQSASRISAKRFYSTRWLFMNGGENMRLLVLFIILYHPCYLLSLQYTVLHILFYTICYFLILIKKIHTYIYVYSLVFVFHIIALSMERTWLTCHCWLYSVELCMWRIKI